MKRATDLTLDELARIGQDAAREAARRSSEAGLPVAGTVERTVDGRRTSVLVNVRPVPHATSTIGEIVTGRPERPFEGRQDAAADRADDLARDRRD